MINPDLLCNNLRITSPEIYKYFADQLTSYQATPWFIKIESCFLNNQSTMTLIFLIRQNPDFSRTDDTCFHLVYSVTGLMGSFQGFWSYRFKFLLDKNNWSPQLLLWKKRSHYCDYSGKILQIHWALLLCSNCRIKCYPMPWLSYRLLL